MEVLGLRAKLRRLSFLISCLCIVALPGFSPARADVPLEYKVKAAFLANFVKFIDWPPAKGKEALICVFGDNPFGEHVVGVIKSAVGEVKGQVLAADSDLRNSSCNVIFNRRGYFGGLSANEPVLTVSDVDSEGVGIVFKLVDNKVRFLVNSGVLQARGLRASSKLLALSLK